MHAATNLWVLTCLLAAWAALVTSHAESSGSSWLDLCESMLKPVDISNGISVKNDSSCLTNATQDGCFLQTCRYCRVDANNTTEQSKFYPACDDGSSSHTESGVIETFSTNSTSNSTATANSTTNGNDTVVLCSVSKGDAEIGLDVFYDESCPGLGCMQYTACRYCKLANITANAHLSYSSCPSKTESAAACSSYITMTGVSSVTESKCANAKPRLVGCVANTSCRLCRNAKTLLNQQLVSCRVLKDEQKATTTSVNAYAAVVEPATVAAASDASVVLTVVGALAGAIAAALLVAFVMRRNGDSDFDPLRDGSLVEIVGKHHIAEL